MATERVMNTVALCLQPPPPPRLQRFDIFALAQSHSYPYTPSDSENCIKKKEILQFIIIIYYVQRSVAPLLTTPL